MSPLENRKMFHKNIEPLKAYESGSAAVFPPIRSPDECTLHKYSQLPIKKTERKHLSNKCFSEIVLNNYLGEMAQEDWR